jgi:hypothetical protein
MITLAKPSLDDVSESPLGPSTLIPVQLSVGSQEQPPQQKGCHDTSTNQCLIISFTLRIQGLLTILKLNPVVYLGASLPR